VTCGWPPSNILHGHSPSDETVDVARYADAIKALDADVLALQEVDRDQPRSEHADLTAIAAGRDGRGGAPVRRRARGTPGSAWVAATGEEQPGTATYGIALLSRYPVRSWQVVRLPSIPFRVPMWLRYPRKFLVVSEEPRVAMAGVIDSPLGVLTIATTHLSFVPGWNVHQLRRLRRDLTPLPDPLVLLGDLNLTRRSAARVTGYRPLTDVATFPTDAPTRQLDHCAASRAARAGALPVQPTAAPV
jgi:endonuclease/exonuclease/phosphatase family metal-dependent hydrolase